MERTEKLGGVHCKQGALEVFLYKIIYHSFTAYEGHKNV